MRGLRHGYGVRTSAPFGLASHYRGGARHGHQGSLSSLTEAAGTPDPSERRTTRMDDARGGFVLKASSDEPGRRGSLGGKTKKGLLSVSEKCTTLLHDMGTNFDHNIIPTILTERNYGWGYAEIIDTGYLYLCVSLNIRKNYRNLRMSILLRIPN